jgi:hypothetical protein
MYTTPPTAALVATCALRRATDTNRPRTADSLPAPNTLSTFLRELLVGDAHKPSVSPYAAHRQTSDAHRISLDKCQGATRSSSRRTWATRVSGTGWRRVDDTS